MMIFCNKDDDDDQFNNNTLQIRRISRKNFKIILGYKYDNYTKT